MTAFGCDGVLCSTPTGSTAYAFSSGGPIMWPDVQALLVVPSNAHAMFSRRAGGRADVGRRAWRSTRTGRPPCWCCDGRRTFELPPGSRVEVVGGAVPLRLARLHADTFTERLVRKFDAAGAGLADPPGPR